MTQGGTMDLFRKVRVLVGALAHGPGARSRDEAGREDEGEQPQTRAAGGRGAKLEQAGADVEDAERVADLIARRKDEAG